MAKHTKAYIEYEKAYKRLKAYARRNNINVSHIPSPSKLNKQHKITNSDVHYINEAHRRQKEYVYGFQNVPNGEDIILNNVFSIADDLAITHPRTARMLRSMINREIERHNSDGLGNGKKIVAEILENADDEIIKQCAIVVFYAPNTTSGVEAFTTLMSILSGGEILSAEEMKRRAEETEEDLYEEFEDPWAE